jgi:hypothetical protein
LFQVLLIMNLVEPSSLQVPNRFTPVLVIRPKGFNVGID